MCTNNITINLSSIHVQQCLFSISSCFKLHISISLGQLNTSIHCQFHIYYITKVTENFLQMTLIHISGQVCYMNNYRLRGCRRFPDW